MPIFRLFFLILIIASCQKPHYVDFFPVSDEGVVKAKIVLLPVQGKDSSTKHLATYLTEAITWYSMDEGKFYFYSQDEINAFLKKQINFFKTEALDKYLLFLPAHYVIDLEVIEDKVRPYDLNLHRFFGNLITVKERQVHDVYLKLKVISLKEQKAKFILKDKIARHQLIPIKKDIPYNVKYFHEKITQQLVKIIKEAIKEDQNNLK